MSAVDCLEDSTNWLFHYSECFDICPVCAYGTYPKPNLMSLVHLKYNDMPVLSGSMTVSGE